MDLSRLKEIMQEAELFAILSKAGTGSVFEKGRFDAILDEAFDWFGGEIILAHAKNPPGIDEAFDLGQVEAGIRALSAMGSPVLEGLIAKLETEEGRRELRQTLSWQPFYQSYLAGLQNAGFRGALIMHGLDEGQVELRTSFLRKMLDSISPKQD